MTYIKPMIPLLVELALTTAAIGWGWWQFGWQMAVLVFLVIWAANSKKRR